MNDWFVVAMGLGVVFVGLISIVIITKIMSFFCVKMAKNKPAAGATKAVKPAVVPTSAISSTQITNKQEFVAAVSAVIAEELGCGIEGIRIHSIKKI